MTQAPTALTDFVLAIEAGAFAWLINRGRNVRQGQSLASRARSARSGQSPLGRVRVAPASDQPIDRGSSDDRSERDARRREARSEHVADRDVRSRRIAHSDSLSGDTRDETLGRWFVLFFSAAAIASVIGGLVHGYFLDPTTLVARSLWPLTLIAVGAAALAAWGIGANIQFSPDRARLFGWIAIVEFLIYAAAVALGVRSFRYAIFNYLPAAFFLLAVFTIAHGRRRNSTFPRPDSASSPQASVEAYHEQHSWTFPKSKRLNPDPMDSSYLFGAIAMVVTLAASALQQARVGILTLGVTHNALYHVLQGLSLLLMFLCARPLPFGRRTTLNTFTEK